MDWQSRLIFLYLTSCDFISQLPREILFKIGPHCEPRFTDAEAITIYIFGIEQNLGTVKSIHAYTKNFLAAWFPHLPEYEAFLSRINNLDNVFIEFFSYVLQRCGLSPKAKEEEKIVLVDSLPIIMSKGYKAKKCVTAKDIASFGYCSSKKLYYYGVKLHVLADYQKETIPSPRIVKITGANMHDFTSMKEHFFEIKKAKIIGDKAYTDKKTKQRLLKKGIEIHTPIKFSKNNSTLDEDEKIYSKIVSAIRQPIEVFFQWLIERSGIQNASKVRSKKGLLVHVFGRFSACLFRQLCL